MSLKPITHLLDQLEAPTPFRGERAGAESGASLIGDFQKILGEKLGDLVGATGEAAKMQREFAAGKTDNIHEVMIAGAKANLAMETAMQVRNLALRAYTQLSQLR